MSRSPAEIARETFKALTQRRLPPTPENYWRVYHEIEGEPDVQPERALLDALLPALGELRPPQRKQIEAAIEARDWPRFAETLFNLFRQNAQGAAWSQPWPDLLRDLLRQWDLRQPGLSSSRKQEMLNRVLVNFGSDVAVLNEKLAGLVRGWSEVAPGESLADAVSGVLPEGEAGVAADGAPVPATAGAGAAAGVATVVPVADVNWSSVQSLVVQALEVALVPRLQGLTELQQEGTTLAQQIRMSDWPRQLPLAEAQLRKYWIKLEMQAEHEGRLLGGVLGVMRLMIDNLSEVSMEDEWLTGQYAVIRNLMAEPLDMQSVYRAELSLKALVVKQGALKHSLEDAKLQLKQLIATFIDRLGSLSDSTGAFHDKVRDYSVQIQRTNQITELSTLVDNLMNDTRAMQLDVLRSRDDLQSARTQAQAAQQKVMDLEAELQQVSEKVREDELTGALNRRGLDEALQREVSRTGRQTDPLCIALLDIDNFKRLNDNLGHQAGDQALQHLVAVVKDTLRPTDAVARYGGEEFVILLPHTGLDEALQVLARLQRELTRRFFLHNNERVLITFSAGVTLFGAEDTEQTALARADAAMYRAKKAGKNRVEQA